MVFILAYCTLFLILFLELDKDIRRVLTESLELLKQAFMVPILTQFPNAQIQDLFTMEFYSHLIGMLEMYDNTIGILKPFYRFSILFFILFY